MTATYKKTILAVSLSFIACPYVLSAQTIAGGGWHSLVVCMDSTVKAFGENATGQLGDGTTVDKNNPVTVPGLSRMIAVSGGGDQLEAHSMALKRDGTVWTWGSNIYGGLGNGTTNSTTGPVQVTSLTGVKQISAGGWHSVALKEDGTVWVWGWNMDGQVGDGTTVDKTSPIQVPGLTGVVKIAAGIYHVLALKSDGTVWAWGDNISGQIGNGTVTTDVKSPVQVSGLNNVKSIAAGRFFSLAVKTDGTVWTWGENKYGQLGDGTTVDKSAPIQVSGLTGVTDAVAATGAFHCMAAKSDNTVWAWGRNTYGNLGDNTIVDQHVPVLMLGVSNVVGLAAGTNFSLLYKNDGTFWGCGRNASGQLGDGTVVERHIATTATGMCSILFQTVGIAKQGEGVFSEMKTFPNPSSDGKYTVTLDNASASLDQDSKIEVYNAIGVLVFRSTAEEMSTKGSTSIDLSSQPGGVYYFTLRSGNYTLNRKLMKQ